jgi:hypothetical protein
MADCSLCDDTGWRPVIVNGVQRFTRCTHTLPSLDAPAAGPGTFALTAPNPGFRAKLSADERRIHDLIISRRGLGQAMRIREVIDIVWPQLLVPRTFEEQKGCEREVKRVIAKLREEGRYLIAASKEKPFGYFVPETQGERQECHDRLFREGWELIKLSQLFVRDEDLGKRLCERAVTLTAEMLRL